MLLACPSCALSNHRLLGIAIFIGGVLGVYLLLHPYVDSMRTKFGWPRIGILSLLALVVLLCLWPGAFLLIGDSRNPHRWTLLAAMAGCFNYLWWRLSWLLQSHQVSRVRQFWYLAVVFPCTIWAGTILALAATACLLVLPVWPSAIFEFLIIGGIGCAVPGSIAWFGTIHVFSDSPLLAPRQYSPTATTSMEAEAKRLSWDSPYKEFS